MGTLEEIESAIAQLPRDQVFQLRKWICDRANEEWDAQIAEDCASGELDAMIAEARAEYKAGRTTPLPRDGE